MMNTKFFRGSTLRRYLIGVGVAVLAMTAVSAPTFAATSTCALTDIAYSSTGMAVICGGTTYAAFQTGTPPSGCSLTSLDTIKLWLSLEQAALLSGKNVKITFTTCTAGNNGITQVDLLQ